MAYTPHMKPSSFFIRALYTPFIRSFDHGSGHSLMQCCCINARQLATSWVATSGVLQVRLFPAQVYVVSDLSVRDRRTRLAARLLSC